MIQIKGRTYSADDYNFLQQVFENAYQQIDDYCNPTPYKCSECKNKVACNDLYATLKYLNEKISESTK